MTSLLQKSLYHTIQGAIAKATTEVRQLPRSVFQEPNLAEILDRIANKYTLEVATLQPEQKRGKRKEIERVYSDYGDRRVIKVPVIEVTIPFIGEAQSFELAPSNYTIISNPCEVTNGGVVVTFADDDQLERNVDDFVKHVSANLNTLRTEVQRDLPQIKAAIEQAARLRKSEIEQEQKRDSGRSFPID